MSKFHAIGRVPRREGVRSVHCCFDQTQVPNLDTMHLAIRFWGNGSGVARELPARYDRQLAAW